MKKYCDSHIKILIIYLLIGEILISICADACIDKIALLIIIALYLVLLTILSFNDLFNITYFNNKMVKQKKCMLFKTTKKIFINDIETILIFNNIIVLSKRQIEELNKDIEFLEELNKKDIEFLEKLNNDFRYFNRYGSYRFKNDLYFPICSEKIFKVLQKTNARKILITNQRRDIQLFNKYFTN